MILNYLANLGFKPVLQKDKLGSFKDVTYLQLNRTFAELHDDGMFYLWLDITTPLYSINVNQIEFRELCENINKIIFNEL